MNSIPRNELSAEARARHRVGREWNFGRLFSVRWSDVDSFAHASHRSHFEWIEETRNHYLAEAGFPLQDQSVPGPVVREVGCIYERPLMREATVLVTARTAWVGRTSFCMNYVVWSEGLVATSFAVCVWVLNSDATKHAVPDRLRAYMQQFDGATERVKGRS